MKRRTLFAWIVGLFSARRAAFGAEKAASNLPAFVTRVAPTDVKLTVSTLRHDGQWVEVDHVPSACDVRLMAGGVAVVPGSITVTFDHARADR